MVTPGGALREFADDWTPIFADPNRQYDYIANIASHRRVKGGVRLRLSGPPWDYRVRFLQPAVAADVRVGGDASGLAVRREDDITVVDVSGGRFELRVDAR